MTSAGLLVEGLHICQIPYEVCHEQQKLKASGRAMRCIHAVPLSMQLGGSSHDACKNLLNGHVLFTVLPEDAL